MSSRSQTDRLGDRLREGPVSDADLRMLEGYRESFTVAYQQVLNTLRARGLNITGRPSKSTSSIVQKLRRETIRLSQVQDIAGCRTVTDGLSEQNACVRGISEAWPDSVAIDRRLDPSHGYRAVHVTARHDGRVVEVQVRTRWQHYWAEISEKLADTVDPNIKYGGGPSGVVAALLKWSEVIHRSEDLVAEVLGDLDRVRRDADWQTVFTAVSTDLERTTHAVLDILTSARQGKR